MLHKYLCGSTRMRVDTNHTIGRDQSLRHGGRDVKDRSSGEGSEQAAIFIKTVAEAEGAVVQNCALLRSDKCGHESSDRGRKDGD